MQDPIIAPAPTGLQLAEQYLLQELQSPEARAVLARLLDQIEATVSSQTANPFLKQLEAAAFATVKGYLAPTAAA